nr:hypothetical protein [Roseovarius tolerans]
MIAERAGVIAHQVHRAQHRMTPAPALSGLCGQIAKRGALKKIAIVEQDAVFCARLVTRLTDKGRDTGEATGLIRQLREVIEGEDVAMHIRRDHHAQAYRRIGGFGVERVWNILSQIQRLHGCTGKGIDRKTPDHVTHTTVTPLKSIGLIVVTAIYQGLNISCVAA